jgi:hypothetical protein
MISAPETSGLGRQGLAPYIALLVPAFSPPGPPGPVSRPLRRPPERSATQGGFHRRATPSAPSLHTRFIGGSRPLRSAELLRFLQDRHLPLPPQLTFLPPSANPVAVTLGPDAAPVKGGRRARSRPGGRHSLPMKEVGGEGVGGCCRQGSLAGPGPSAPRWTGRCGAAGGGPARRRRRSGGGRRPFPGGPQRRQRSAAAVPPPPQWPKAAAGQRAVPKVPPPFPAARGMAASKPTPQSQGGGGFLGQWGGIGGP